MVSPSLSSEQSATLEQAVQFLLRTSAIAPSPEAVVEALLSAEKRAKQERLHHRYEQLQGTWRLGFITGTKRTRQRAGIALGAGRFLPRWTKILLTYRPAENGQGQGQVDNSVNLGLFSITLAGPTRFWENTNLLAFDFIRMVLQVSGLKLYQGYIRGGQQREATFCDQPLKEQAFFNYFLVQEHYIAARGRGGGLALWVRVD